MKYQSETHLRKLLGRPQEGEYRTPGYPLVLTMSDLNSESSEDEQYEVEKRPQGRTMNRPPLIQLISRSRAGSPGGSPKNSPKDSPRGSPRNSPLLFRKLLMNRSINLQRRRFTLAHTPRYAEMAKMPVLCGTFGLLTSG